jgi:predicted Zn-dependent protease with MMP-like domain
MPVNRWFFGSGSRRRDRLVKALQQARDGDTPGGVETIAERFPEALADLEAMRLSGDPGWLRLAAWLAYRAGDIPRSSGYANQALAHAEDAQTWSLLGRLRLWERRPDADEAFRRAARLDPNRFVVPYRVKHQRFMQMAERALAAIPHEFQDRLGNTLIVVDDLPDLDAVREGEDPDLLGLYEGATVLEHGLPERIVLYQRNHENISASERELEHEAAETMRHEIGHHFGMAEDEIPY